MKACPYCAEEIQDAAIKCRYCSSDLAAPPPPRQTGEVSSPAEHRQGMSVDERYRAVLRPDELKPTDRSMLTLAEQELVFQTVNRKSAVIAILLNLLWAGAGNVYVGSCSGGAFVGFTTFFWFMAAVVGTPVIAAPIVGLFFWASVLAVKEIDRQAAEVRSRISRGFYDRGVK